MHRIEFVYIGMYFTMTSVEIHFDDQYLISVLDITCQWSIGVRTIRIRVDREWDLVGRLATGLAPVCVYWWRSLDEISGGNIK